MLIDHYLLHLEHPACKIFDHYTSNSSIQEPVSNLATLLYKEDIIKQEFIPHRSSREGGQSVLKQVKKAVCDDYQILEKFAAILQQSPSTIETGKAIMDKYSESRKALLLIMLLD